jgi:hypothetical protein
MSIDKMSTTEEGVKMTTNDLLIACLDLNEQYLKWLKDKFTNRTFTAEELEMVRTINIKMLSLVEEEEEEEDQDKFTNRMCENDKCKKEFDLTEPHYYDEEQGVCYCCKECLEEEEDEILGIQQVTDEDTIKFLDDLYAKIQAQNP